MMGAFDDSDENSCKAQEVFMKRSMRSAFIRVDVCAYIKFSGLCGCVSGEASYRRRTRGCDERLCGEMEVDTEGQTGGEWALRG